ncbi:hypothetical protein AHF37_08624 [Paragonimus kellicotti]|nr:hypothetical protein AHF37_08624 [Paragonimus kellicotti]
MFLHRAYYDIRLCANKLVFDLVNTFLAEGHPETACNLSHNFLNNGGRLESGGRSDANGLQLILKQTYMLRNESVASDSSSVLYRVRQTNYINM